MQYNRINKVHIFDIKCIDVLTVIYCGFCILELSTASYKYICLALLFLWGLLAFLFDKNAAKKVFANRAVQILFLYSVILFFYVSFVNDVILGAKIALTLVINESPFFIFIYYKNRNSKYDRSNVLVWGGLVIILILCMNLLRLLAVDPNAARIMAGEHNIYENYIAGGGYQLAYALALLTPFLIFSFKVHSHKVMVFLFIVIFSYTLVQCSYTIALLLAVFELLMLFYLKNPQRYKSICLVLLSLPIFFVMFFCLRAAIAEMIVVHIAPLFSGLFIEHRIKQIGELFAGCADEYNGAVVRFNLYWESFRTFLDFPLIGISYLTKFNYILEADYIGQHSTVFDGLARMGSLFFLYLIYFKKAIMYLKRKTGSNHVVAVGVVFFLIKSINLGNAFGLSYAAFFCVPFLADRFVKQNRACWKHKQKN